jgi:hypothetical protein
MGRLLHQDMNDRLPGLAEAFFQLDGSPLRIGRSQHFLSVRPSLLNPRGK